MKRLDRSEVEEVVGDNLGVIDDETLAKLYGDYAEPDGVLWDEMEGCFWQPETEDEAIRTVTVFEVSDDGQEVPRFLGCVALPPSKTVDDLQPLYSGWENALAEQEAEIGGNDNLEVSDDFVTWLQERQGFVSAKEAEGFAFLHH